MGDPITNINHPGDIAAAIKAGSEQIVTLPELDGHKPQIVVPVNHKLLTRDKEKLDRPRFLTACPRFNDPATFIDYINDFMDQNATRIWHDGQGKFLAVLDYHDRGHGARHGDHLAILELVRSPEWKAWVAKDEQAMDQRAFAEFIEDNADDFVAPDAAKMLEIATGLNAKADINFRSAINQANGTIQLLFDENVSGTVRSADQPIPTEFEIGIRPFMGCDRYPVQCRLRYRIPGGSLKLHYKALRMDRITETVGDAVVEKITETTGIRPALGAANHEVMKKGE